MGWRAALRERARVAAGDALRRTASSFMHRVCRETPSPPASRGGKNKRAPWRPWSPWRTALAALRDDTGAALLTVLLLIAVMATVAVAVMDEIRFAARRAANVEAREQARWYALGAEAYASALVKRLVAADPDNVRPPEGLAREGAFFPIDGGRLAAFVRDGDNCFDLNRLLEEPVADEDAAPGDGAGAAPTPPPSVLTRYRWLLQALDFASFEADILVDAAADWIDEDGETRDFGAEDFDYASANPPYRAANTPLVEVGELRAVAGYSPEVMARLRPFVCARPAGGDARPLNVDSLTPEQAPLLVAVFGPEILDLDAARRALLDRPVAGWRSVDAFLAHPEIARVRPPADVKSRLGVSTRTFDVEAEVVYRERRVVLNATLRAEAGGAITLLARSFGGDR